MKNIITYIQTFFIQHIHSKNVLYRKEAIRPGTDWRNLLVIFCILFVISLVFNIYVYTQVNVYAWWHTETAGTTDGITINKKLLEDIVSDFSQREKNVMTETNQKNITDPYL
jgi:hypothetical protein